jgi:hypothetical protein
VTTWGCAFNYDDVNRSTLPSFGTVVAGRQSVLDGSNGFYRELMQGGVEVQQYIGIVDVNGYVGGEFDRRFASGAATLGSLSNWPGFKIVNIADAAWVAHLKEQFKWVCQLPFPEDKFGIFWDVFGERLWVGAWASMPQAAFKTGMRAFGEWMVDYRDAQRPGMKMVVNGTWTSYGGFPGMCPCVEHHGLDAFWRDYVAPQKWDHNANGQGFAVIIASGSGDGPAWKTVPGVGPIAAQATYGGPGYNVAPGVKAVPRDGAGTGTPTPTPPPSTGLPRPTAPKNLTAVASAVTGDVGAAWSPNPAAEKIDSYRTYLDGAALLPDTTAPERTIKGLTRGRSYGVRVSAHNASTDNAGHGPWSDPEVKVTIPPVLTPDTPLEPGPTPTPEPPVTGIDPALVALWDRQETGYTAVINSLKTAEGWKRLTQPQKDRITAAIGRLTSDRAALRDFRD